MNSPDPTLDASGLPAEPDPDAAIDVQIAEILDEYLRAAERGEAVDRCDFLAQHGEHAGRLAELLDGVELFEQGETLGLAIPEQPTLPNFIGDFEILGELGRGGMGVVYEAREKSLDRIVALKVMRFGIVDPKALERFQREAETAGALHHTNIVPVYATGREGDTSWYAMQRIEGHSLDQRIARARKDKQPIDLDELLNVGIQAAEALDHAHEREVVHRDVKPANLIIDGEDRVWLTDFGLARRLVDVGATMTGAILGTPRYMSPEQADLKTTEIDHRSDIYSLGATLYEMATLQPPFDGDDPLKMISQIRYDDPRSPRSIRSDLPRDLEVVLEKCMAKESKRRYGSASELADDLRAIADDRPIKARAVSSFERATRWMRKHQTRVRVAAATVLVTAIAIGLLAVAATNYRERTLGSFRLRAAGGPYMTRIYPVGQTSLSSSAMELTVPMQTHRKLTAGDYEMLLAPQGRWSRKLRLPIAVGTPSEYRLTTEKVESKEIELGNSLTIAVAGQAEPAILARLDGLLSRTTLSGENAWQLAVSDIKTPITNLEKAGGFSDAGTEQIDFAAWEPNLNFHHGHRSIDDQPPFAKTHLALQTPIDLDGDGLSDTLIAASDRSALMAIDHFGQALWHRSFRINGLPSASTVPDPYSGAKKLSIPGVLQMIDAGDLDDDQISDVVVLLVHARLGQPIEVCIVAVSGQTGEPIHSMFPPAIKATKGYWPTDAIMSFDRHQNREYSSLGFNSTRAYRSNGSQLNRFEIRFLPRSSPIHIPMPSPMQLVRSSHGNTTIVYLAGDECRRFELRSGKELGTPMKLAFIPGMKPSIARGGDSTWLGFIEITQSWQRGGRNSGSQFAVHHLNGKPAWKRRLELMDWSDALSRNLPNWPLATDLNSDGIGEFVLPTSQYRNGVELGLTLVGVANGNPLWPNDLPMQLSSSAENCISRIAVTDDLDADGWDDLVVASVAGPASPDATQKRNAEIGDAFVYIDWISGKTGLSLSWARHPIPIVSNEIRIADIDAIRTKLPSSRLGAVEIDFVTGDTTKDAELDSMVLRFHPESPDADAVAAGLDVVVTPDTNSNSRVFRRRSGPYLNGADRLVLMNDAAPPRLRLGEQHVVATWNDRQGRSLIAVTGLRPPRLSVIDGQSYRTLWTSEQSNKDGYQWDPIRRGDGRVDFLRRVRRGEDYPVTLIDGETGDERWTTSENTGGRTISAHFIDDDDAMMIIGRGQLYNGSSGNKPPNSFKLSVVNSKTGNVRWSQYFLYKAPRYNFPHHFDDMQWGDVNDDGIDDIIGPFQKEDDDTLHLAAFDGNNGKIMWTKSLERQGSSTDYFILFKLIDVSGIRHVVYLGPDDEDKTTQSLILCNAASGQRVAKHRIEKSQHLSYVDRNRLHQNANLINCSVSPDQPRVALQFLAPQRCRCTILSLDDGEFEAIETSDFDRHGGSVEGVWLRDVDGDRILERLVLVGPSANQNDQRLQLLCLPLTESEPRWQLIVPQGQQVEYSKWLSLTGNPVIWLRMDRGHGVAIDCREGTIQHIEQQPFRDFADTPLVVMSDQGENAMELAIPTADGIEFRSLDDADRSAVSIAHLVHDPRRVMSVVTSARYPNAVSDLVGSLLRGVITAGTLLVLPLWYAFVTLARRRWSLSWLMVAPPVVGIWFLFWKLPWVHDPTVGMNLAWAIGPWAFIGVVFFALRERKRPDTQIATRLYLVVGSTLMFVVLMGWEYSRATNPTVEYTLTFRDVLLVAMMAVGLVSVIYWILRVPVEIGRWIGRAFRIGATR